MLESNFRRKVAFAKAEAMVTAMAIGIGIDTGGTYTDAVIWELDERRLLASAKALTTRRDLKVGIGNALDRLPRELLVQAKQVALSTTLATNACVENKGGRTKLILIGVNPKAVQAAGADYGLPPLEEIYLLDARAPSENEAEIPPDWERFTADLSTFQGYTALAVVQLGAYENNAAYEKRAKTLLEPLGVPVICGHELFSELNSLKRAASALLNARLIPVIEEFLDAMEEALRQRGVEAPMVIVRSDGTLMSRQFTCIRPVETLLCGPAASVSGAIALTSEENSLIVDMGGTTTDIAMVKNGVPVKVDGGIRIGNWHTFVKGLYIDTFGLGGDSAVRYKGPDLILDTKRVIPLCIAAADHPEIVPYLRRLHREGARHSRFLHEFLLLMREPGEDNSYEPVERELCAVLRNGPLPLEEAARAMDRDVYQLRTGRLEEEGVIMRAGLTPTDIMHIRGDFSQYSTEAARLGADFVSRAMGTTTERLCKRVYNEVEYRMFSNLARILLEDQNPWYKEHGLGEGLELQLRTLWENRNREDAFVSLQIATPAVLIGIGAPVHLFLPEVAKALHTRCIVPESAGVANALGAIAANVAVTSQVEIKLRTDETGESYYMVYGGDRNFTCSALDRAKSKAAREARKLAAEEAERRGAGEVTISVRTEDHIARAHDLELYLGTTVTATAVCKK